MRNKRACKNNKTRRFYVLKLYVTGASPSSTRAITNVRHMCQEHLQGRYELQVVDLYHHPKLAKSEQIIAAPTLIKTLPAPIRRFVGDMSNCDTILIGLNLKEKGTCRPQQN